MKDNFINLKNKIVPFFVNMKNKTVSFVVANKKISIISIAILIVLMIGIIIACNRTEIGNTNGNLNNLGFSVEKSGAIYYLGFDEGSSDGIYKVKGKKREKINEDYGFYLNKSGNYIYY